MTTITINPELQSLIPPLSDEEYQQLEQNILQDGCRDPLIVWQEEQTLLDGHNRHDICERHGLDYRLTELSLPSLDAAKVWMVNNQLGRRNLTPEQMSYFRGKQYDLQKKVSRGGGDRKSAEAKDQKPQNEGFDNTAQELAAQHKVSRATIERDAAYAKAVDTLADTVGQDIRQAILARDNKMSKAEVTQLAKVAKTHPQTATSIVATVKDQLANGKPPREAVHHAFQVHEVTMPTPALADAVAQATDRQVMIPATDGFYHDGRTKDEEAAAMAQTKRLFQLFHALEALATLPDLEQLLEEIPDYCVHRIDDHLDKAVATLAEWTRLWKGRHQQPQTSPPEPQEPAAADIPYYDTDKFFLGKMCSRKHEWGTTGQTLYRRHGRYCQPCNTEKRRKRTAMAAVGV
jgi:hypothetical protein